MFFMFLIDMYVFLLSILPDQLPDELCHPASPGSRQTQHVKAVPRVHQVKHLHHRLGSAQGVRVHGLQGFKKARKLL